MLPLSRALAVVGNTRQSRMAYGQYGSANNIIFNGYGSSDPESAQYVYEFNAYDLPKKATRMSYYFDVLEETRVCTLYYYQGDPIP